ncbi:MAG: hypothetical protein NTY35_00055 [Planctomycetota bacterium]|nr:hypothetical protein [Planctomycetota bacterium]
MSKPPVVVREVYNQRLAGYFGEFGGGANAQCIFVQTALSVNDLKRVELVSEIPGSEKWPVRHLFQREVDTERVTKGLIPYFEDAAKVKFFNPLTLTLIAKDADDPTRIDPLLPELAEGSIDIEQTTWRFLERPGVFRFRWIEASREFGIVEWNDERVRVVAIDGQHRLSALKRCVAKQGDGAAKRWVVPAVVFGLRKIDPRKQAGTILDFVRNIFVYINTEARRPNEARTILLTDESVNRVCVQEVLQYCHENDSLPRARRALSRAPLLMFDWRGLEEGGERLKVRGTVFGIEELHEWLESYVLGEDLTEDQKTALLVDPQTPELFSAFQRDKLAIEASEALRKHFSSRVLPGIAYLLENFSPLKRYIHCLRSLEAEMEAKSDIAQYAFAELRFGANQAGDKLQKDIQAEKKEIEDMLESKKNTLLLAPLDKDIGWRGIMAAFGMMRGRYVSAGGASEWEAYAVWFTKHLNAVYAAGWLLDSQEALRKHRLHITHDQNDDVVNYRVPQARVALGLFIMALVAHQATSKKDVFNRKSCDALWEVASDDLGDTIRRGWKKYWKPILKEEGKVGQELTAAIRDKAEESTRKQLEKLKKALDDI